MFTRYTSCQGMHISMVVGVIQYSLSGGYHDSILATLGPMYAHIIVHVVVSITLFSVV